MPNVRRSQPWPPPRVRPATPVVDTIPPTATRPKAWVSRSTSPQVAPPSARTSRLSTSTRTARIGDRSITMPPSQVAKPAALCAPPRTATSRLVLSGETNCPQDVSHAAAADDERRPFVDHLVEDATRLLVVRAIGQDGRAAEILRELVDRSTVDVRFRPESVLPMSVVIRSSPR